MRSRTPRGLTGWGRNLHAASALEAAGSDEHIMARMATGGPVLARGNGRSYGDAALNGSGLVFDMLSRRRLIRADWDLGAVTVEAGMLLVELLAEVEAHGWTLPVVPGTSLVSVGGAVASDVHGKNHEVAGTFGCHVEELELVSGPGQLLILRPGDPRFAATVGGMGLTGVIVRVSLRLMRRGSGLLRVRRRRAADIDAVLAALSESSSDFSVAWIDLLSRGGLGRGIVSEADRVAGPASPPRDGRGSGRRLRVDLPSRTVSATSVSLFNGLYFRAAPQDGTRVQDAAAFHFPLDAIGEWNRAYGGAGFVQYQFVVPLDEDASVIRILEELRRAGVPGFLAVLKRLGPERAGILSFPMRGWSLALDIPARHPGLRSLARRLDAYVLDAGGRVYLTKDSLLDRQTFRAMVPETVAWREVRDEMDPDGRLSSDLGRRLGLVGPGSPAAG